MKKFFTLSIISASLLLVACNQQDNAPSAKAASASNNDLQTEAQKLGYLIGYDAAQSMNLAEMKKNGLTIDTDALVSAINDQIEGKPAKITPEQAQEIIQSLQQKMQAVAETKANNAKAEGEKFLAENKTKAGIKTTESGLQYKVNTEGTGAQVTKGDLATVEYEGRLTNGEVFDSTALHGGQDFPVPVIDGTVIQGWIEGLQLMKEGSDYTLYIPANLAYGDRAASEKIPANSVLVFDIKVKKVEKNGAKKMLEEMKKTQH